MLDVCSLYSPSDHKFVSRGPSVHFPSIFGGRLCARGFGGRSPLLLSWAPFLFVCPTLHFQVQAPGGRRRKAAKIDRQTEGQFPYFPSDATLISKKPPSTMNAKLTMTLSQLCTHSVGKGDICTAWRARLRPLSTF